MSIGIGSSTHLNGIYKQTQVCMLLDSVKPRKHAIYVRHNHYVGRQINNILMLLYEICLVVTHAGEDIDVSTILYTFLYISMAFFLPFPSPLLSLL